MANLSSGDPHDAEDERRRVSDPIDGCVTHALFELVLLVVVLMLIGLASHCPGH